MLDFISPDIPIAKTSAIGHATDSRALVIGQPMELK